MNASAIIAFVVVLGSVACSHKNEPAHISGENWAPGQSHRFNVWVVDSGYVADSSFGKLSRRYQVAFTVLDTVGGPTIEWQEFMADEATSVFNEPLTRIVYRTTREGRFGHILNYDELRAYADTMATIYLRGAGVDSVMASAIKAATLDSIILLSNLSKQINLFHRLYGATFHPSPTGDSVTWSGVDPFEAIPVHCFLRENSLCDADDRLTSLIAWDDHLEVDASSIVRTFMGDAMKLADPSGNAIIDSMGMATVSDSLSMCFWDTKGIPVHIEQIRVGRPSFGTFKKYVTIELLPE